MILLDHIKDDWLYRLPFRLDHMKFKGVNRPAYTIICLAYYSIKSLLLLSFVALFYEIKFAFLFFKFIFWDIWIWIFKVDKREWFRSKFSAYDDEDYEDEEIDIPTTEDDTEDLPFCQLFQIGPHMCLLVDHVEMCPDEVAFIRTVDDEGYTPLYKRKVRRDKAGNRFIVFNGTNHYLDNEKTRPVITKK